jgi:hypothetical protein
MMQLIQSILMLACGGQFTVEVIPAFTVEVRQDITVESDGQQVRLTPTDRPGRFSFSAKPAGPPALSRYLVKFTSDTCGPCKSWEAKERPQLDAAGVAITVVDCTNGNTWGVTRVPEFWVVDKDPRKVVEKFKGYTTAEALYDSLSEPVSSCELLGKPEQLPVVIESASWIYNGKAGSSHKDRQSLISHLLNEGIHSGRHTSETLNAMSDADLNNLHESDHGNKSQPARVQQSGNCPGGNCPTNRVQRRRGGILGGMFR